MSVYLKSALALTALAALEAAVSHPAAAQGLDGTTVTGQLNFFGNPINYFIPMTAVVSESQTEFTYSEIVNKDNSQITADFTSNQLVLTRKQSTDTGSGGSAATYTFIDPAFTGVTKLSDSFIGGLTYSLVGDTLTINQPAFGFDGTYNATFRVNSVPEASTLASLSLLLALGAGGIMTMARRKKAAI